MNKFYAQIDEDNIVTGVMQTHGEIIAADMIEIQAYDEAAIDDLYDPSTGIFTPQSDPPIRVITVRAFYFRLSVAERQGLRTSVVEEVADLREDLMRLSNVDLDGIIEAQLQATNLLTQIRINELLVDGTGAETITE